MKIVICASSTFRKEMVDFRNKLNQMGHQAIIHQIYEELVVGKMPELIGRIEKEHAKVKREYGFIKWYYNAIVNSDGILVLNYDKGGIKNYIGGNTLMEIGFAHVNDKKVFLLNPAPEGVSYKEEILAMIGVVLNGDLSRIV